MSDGNVRVIKELKISEDDDTLYIRFRGKTDLVEAKILELKKDANGEPISILLDRLIHKHDETSFYLNLNNRWQDSFMLSGCYVSCMTRSSIQ